MHGHTGFLVSLRRLAPGTDAPLRKKRPAPGAYGEDYTPATGEWEAADLGERPVSDKKLRRTRRDAEATATRVTGSDTEPEEET